jgi:hypothetical protein
MPLATRLVAAALCTILAACQPGDKTLPEERSESAVAPRPSPSAGSPVSSDAEPAPAPEPATAADPAVLRHAEDLVGQYRVAGVDGQSIDLPHGITAAISGERIDITSSCVRMAWSYRFEGTAIVTSPVPVLSCQRGLLPEEAAIDRAFGAASSVRRTPSNGVEFAGGGHDVTLFSQ